LLLLGTALTRRGAPGDLDRAHALLGEALVTFEQVGARPSIDETVAELARLNVRPAEHGGQRLASSVIDGTL